MTTGGIALAPLGIMNTSSNHNPKDTAANPPGEDGSPRHKPRVHAASALADRAGAFARGLPTQLDEQLRRNPYRTLAVACMAATTVGIVLSSRVLRAVLTATMSAAAIDLVRAAVRGDRANVEAA
jgi:hypothetical protein